MSREYKTIIFDADGQVLIPHEYFSVKYARENNLNLEKIEMFFKTEWQAYIKGFKDLKEDLPALLHSWNAPHSSEEFLRKWFEYESNKDEKIIALIKKLREQGVVCCLVTNNEKHRVDYMKKELGFSSLFDFIFPSCEIGAQKPEYEIYKDVWRQIREHLGDDTTKQEVLFCDDDEKNITGALTFGFQAFHYRDNFDDFEKEVLL